MIMTSSFQRPYFKDFIFPAGKLREFRSGVKRADVLLITRFTGGFVLGSKRNFLKNININVPVFFTKIRYADVLMRSDKSIDSSVLTGEEFLLVTGIADTHHLITHLKKKYKTFDHIKFKDHHHYTVVDAQMINDRAEKN